MTMTDLGGSHITLCTVLYYHILYVLRCYMGDVGMSSY